jgi:hypothetical protein
MDINRRHALVRSAALLVSAWGNSRVAVAAGSKAGAGLDTSPLIYLSPLVSDGRESRCQAEIWFVHHNGEIFVVTWTEKWRAEAMRRGFHRAKIWVGDFGPWKQANEAYRSAPSHEIEGRFETDAAVHSTLLAEFASKYETQWGAWDRQVRDGLVNGAWVMLRYQIVS